MKNIPNFNKPLSVWFSLFLIAGIVFFRFVYPPIYALSWDVFGYYLYLPATFIYHDFWLQGKNPVLIDNLKIDIFE